jgi:hypothetical protein
MPHTAPAIALASGPISGQTLPWPAVPAPAGQPPKGSGLAITALVFALLGGIVVAIPLAVVSLVRGRTVPHRGRPVAVAALAVSGEWLLVGAAALLAAILSAQPGNVVTATASAAPASPSGQPAAASSEIGFADLRIGDSDLRKSVRAVCLMLIMVG